MIICDGCFYDKEISSIIKSVSRNSGVCPTCHKHDKKLYDTDLTPYFEDLVNTYTPEELLPPSFPAAEKRRLMDDLNERWQIFSDIPYPTQYEILRNICSELYASTPSLFDGLVGIPELYDDLYLKNHMLLRTNNWDLFVNEIKTVNRYHSKLVNLDILEKCIKQAIASIVRESLKKRVLISILWGLHPQVRVQKDEQMHVESHAYILQATLKPRCMRFVQVFLISLALENFC